MATLTGDNGLLQKAGQAKNASEIAEEKDIISISAIQAQSENKYGSLEESKFTEALNTNSKTGNKASIIAEDIGSFTVKFESNRYYEVNKNGNISYIENATGEKTLKVQCVNSKNEVLGEYEYTIVTDRYSKLPQAIDKYESSEERIEGEITENKTIQVLYYLICNDDTTLVFTGLNSNGNITTNENEIESYMVGDGTNAEGNGLKENIRSLESIVKVPDNYKNKSVITISRKAFAYTKIIEVIIGDNVTYLGDYSLYNMKKLTKLTMGSDITRCGSSATGYNDNLKTVTFKFHAWPNGMAFAGDNNFSELKIEGNEDVYTVVDNVLYSADGKTLIHCPLGKTGKFVIPESIKENVLVENLSGTAFFRSRLSEVIIPDCITTISGNAFDASSITKIVIGEKVNHIGVDTFRSNVLTEVIINSPTIAGLGSNTQYNFQSVIGQLLRNNPIIYINQKISNVGNFITDNYDEAISDKEGYVKYIKK